MLLVIIEVSTGQFEQVAGGDELDLGSFSDPEGLKEGAGVAHEGRWPAS